LFCTFKVLWLIYKRTFLLFSGFIYFFLLLLNTVHAFRVERLENDIRCQFHQRSMSSFYVHRSRKCKKDSQVLSFFTLSGSVHIKAARRTLMKLTPEKKARICFQRKHFYNTSNRMRTTKTTWNSIAKTKPKAGIWLIPFSSFLFC